MGVCLDTCHLFSAGYDIRTAHLFENVMTQFDEIIGPQFLKAVHLNDSKAGTFIFYFALTVDFFVVSLLA